MLKPFGFFRACCVILQRFTLHCSVLKMLSSERSQKKSGSNSKKKASKHVMRAMEERPKSQSKGKKIVGFFQVIDKNRWDYELGARAGW